MWGIKKSHKKLTNHQQLRKQDLSKLLKTNSQINKKD